MTLSTTSNRKEYTATGGDTFAYDFLIFDDDHLKIYVDGVLQVLTTDYIVTGVGSPTGGNVVFESASVPASGAIVVILRDVPLTQIVDYTANSKFPAETHEQALDKLTMIVQQLQEAADRSIKLGNTLIDSGGVSLGLTASQRASKLLGFDTAGDLTAYDSAALDAVNSKNIYYADPSNADQGITAEAGNGKTIYDLVEQIGTSLTAVIVLAHRGTGNKTTYTLTTPESIPSNIFLVIQNGAILNGAGTITIYSPAHIVAQPDQQIFGSSITVSFSQPGEYHVHWRGATGDDSTDDTANITLAITDCPTNGTLSFLDGRTYVISGNPALSFNKDMGIKFNNARFSYDDSGTAVIIGNSALPRLYDIWSDGRLEVNRIESISHNGTQTAASQLLGTGIKFQHIQNAKFGGPFYVSGFQYGYYFGNGATVFEVHNLQSQDNLIDFYFDPSSDSGALCTAIDLYSVFNVFNPAHYSSIVGSRGVEMVKNTKTCDGHNFWGGVLEAAKERKLKIDANWCYFNQVYFDTSNGGTDIEIVSGAQYNRIIAGAGDVNQSITDNGTKTDYRIVRNFWIDKNGDLHLGRSNTNLGIYSYTEDSFANGSYNAILDTSSSGWVTASLTKASAAIGDGTTQWDITNPSGDTFRYTWDGNGTDPGLAAGSHRGTIVIAGGTFNAANTGTFNIDSTDTNYFEITNASGVVENDVTGNVSWYIAESATWVFSNDRIVVKVSGTTNSSDTYYEAYKLSAGDESSEIRIYNRMVATCEFRMIVFYN